MMIAAIRSDIEGIDHNVALYDDRNVVGRQTAIDFLDFHVLDRIDTLLQQNGPSTALLALKQYAARVKDQLEAVDTVFFQRLRASIRAGRCLGTSLRALISSHTSPNSDSANVPPAIGYDELDVFTNGLFATYPMPAETRERAPEMVYYQKTPARIIFEVARKAQFTGDDVFYDIGAGLGQVAMWVNLLTGVITKGVELEPAYCTYASNCAVDLNLAQVTFVEADARSADYTDGTVFYMYTPFEGHLLQAVLDRIREASRGRQITLFTYGPCTHHVARQTWLKHIDHTPPDADRLAEFRSVFG
ncbi:hypothetical protein [Fibrella arboris]|uniref:hypothetical protein n=1 Tax=Fibrella arboris TaxID=3242486 RepID=UPI003520BE10